MNHIIGLFTSVSRILLFYRIGAWNFNIFQPNIRCVVFCKAWKFLIKKKGNKCGKYSVCDTSHFLEICGKTEE